MTGKRSMFAQLKKLTEDHPHLTTACLRWNLNHARQFADAELTLHSVHLLGTHDTPSSDWKVNTRRHFLTPKQGTASAVQLPRSSNRGYAHRSGNITGLDRMAAANPERTLVALE